MSGALQSCGAGGPVCLMDPECEMHAQRRRNQAAPSGPDLSHLLATDRALYTRLVLAMIGGAEWQTPGERDVRWVLFGPRDGEGFRDYLAWSHAGSVEVWDTTPDPERDTAAAREMETRERIAVIPLPDRRFSAFPTQHREILTYEGQSPNDFLREAAGWAAAWRLFVDTSRPRAVLHAVLTQHAAGPLADLIRPLLESEGARG